MTLSPLQFLRHIGEEKMSIMERALGLLFLAGIEDHGNGLSAHDIAEQLRAAGYAKQNVSRLDATLKADRRTVKCGETGWRLSPKARVELSNRFVFVSEPTPLPERDSVLLVWPRKNGHLISPLG